MPLADLADPGYAPDPKDAARLIAGLASDSRDVRPGFLFAALPGAQRQGLDFVEDALARGASALLVPDAAPPPPAPALRAPNPRAAFARMNARFHARQPETAVAVTGTNGKTSVVSFVRHIWRQLGLRAASLGTLGLETAHHRLCRGLTTPAPETLHRLLALLARRGISHVALEASSHGLAQSRLDGVRLKAAAFTLLGRDHLDYHRTPEEYLNAKLRLGSELLPEGGTLVVERAAPGASAAARAAKAAKRRIFTIGNKPADNIQIRQIKDAPKGQRLKIACQGRDFAFTLPLIGRFQASNALIAAGLALAAGAPPRKVFAALEALPPVPGRLEEAGRLFAPDSAARIYIDYAHSPDALRSALQALRPLTSGRLWLVFGCGGDRDHSKRAAMGALAAELADRVIVTDDNPRFEDAAKIRAGILAACPGAREIPERADAIAEAILRLAPGDALIIAGKGHEEGQERAGVVSAFSDRECVRALLGRERRK